MLYILIFNTQVFRILCYKNNIDNIKNVCKFQHFCNIKL